MKHNKKAFTVVELVIVIAIIAILAAVLIPTFANIIKKANVSKDQQLIRNLNTALASSRAENAGKNHANMTEALASAEAFGYDVNKINKSALDNEILWDSVNDVFCYFDNDVNSTKKIDKIKYIPETDTAVAKNTSDDAYNADKVNLVDYWVISNEVSADFSTYYTGDLKAFTTANGNALTKGFDAGNCVGITAIEYNSNSAQKVVVRTNGWGTIFTVNAPNGTVHHYAELDKLIVNAIATASYHEHGQVKVSATINNGHFVAEAGAVVKELLVPASATSVTLNIKPLALVEAAVLEANVPMTVDAGADVNLVVADDVTQITGAGATEAKANAVTKTEVGTKAELLAAIANENVKYIVLTANIDAEDRITIDRDLIIDGSANKYSISVSKENISNGRAINIGWDNTDISVTLKNLKVVGPTSGGFNRGLNVGQENTTLIVDNCEVSCRYYALNVISGANGAEIFITGSKFTGWAALNLWSSIKIDVSDSELIGSSISKGEGFATICFEADTTEKTNLHVSDAKITVKNSIIKTIFDYEDGKGYQAMVGYNYSDKNRPEGADHNEFEAINCTIQWEGPDDNLLKVYDYTAISAQSTNVTIINGEKVESDTWYCEK